MPSPTPYPGDLAAQATAKIDRRWIHALPGGGCPELQGVAMTAAPMATVATARHVHRASAATSAAPASRQGTASRPLRPRPARRLEPQQVQHRLHRHYRTNPLEVHPGHEASSLS